MHFTVLLLKKNLGGKLLICQTTLPTYGPNGLKTREDPKLYGTEKEKTLLVPQDASYRTLAEQCVDEGLCVDLFLFPNAYIDIATLGMYNRKMARRLCSSIIAVVELIFLLLLYLALFRCVVRTYWW